MGVRHDPARPSAVRAGVAVPATGSPRVATSGVVTASGGSSLRLTRRGRVVVVLATLILLSLGLSVGHATLASGPEGASVRVHVVRPGETLWEIARRVEPGRDPRPVVFDICQLNDGDCAGLEAGQRLAVPVR
jgi:LysM repeat protein